MRLQRVAGNTAIVTISTIAGVLLCEAGARLFLNPADYLTPTMTANRAMGMSVAEGSAGFDKWGFRNVEVPASADVVAIGDSHTYGNTATMADSWPYVVASQTGLKVYSLSLGGYGPNQYYRLLLDRALQLKPRWVVVGLYMGDDFQNAFSITYGLDYWASFRQENWRSVNADIWNVTEASGDIPWHKPIRVWLSGHSVTYRLLFHGPLLGAVKGSIQINEAERRADPAVTTLTVANEGIEEAFRPIYIRERLNIRTPEIREGMRITLSLLGQMNEAARRAGSRFAVAIIPTKETVFADYLLRHPGVRLRTEIQDLVTMESEATRQVIAALDAAGIPHIETLPELRRHLRNHLYVRSDKDMHPNRNGYHVIGDAVAQFLKRQNTQAVVRQGR
jgi:hypothetical protein